MTATWLLIWLFVGQSAVTCKDVETCRAEALIAHAREDFEAFHDFAWEAVRKGTPNDPELMLLLARAQSLSGRPGDALVMLERVAALKKLTSDVFTDPDFERVRALPRWETVRADLERVATEPSAAKGTGEIKADTEKTATETRPEPPAVPTTPDPKKAEEKEEVPPAKPEPKKPEPKKPEPKKPETKPADPVPPPAKPDVPKTEPPKDPVKPAPAPPARADEAAEAPPRDPDAPLKFSTVLTPTALAYDGVSKRFIIADRRARRVAVVDENTGHVDTLVGALGGLGDVQGIAIDTQQGDLWIVTSGADGDMLHRTQLISGRVRSTSPITGAEAAIAALAYVRGAGLIAADVSGVLWKIAPSGRAERLAALEYVPVALAADGTGLIVSAGGPRLARFSLAPFRRAGTIEAGDEVSTDGPFAIFGGRLLSLVTAADGFEIRRTPIR